MIVKLAEVNANPKFVDLESSDLLSAVSTSFIPNSQLASRLECNQNAVIIATYWMGARKILLWGDLLYVNVG